MPLSPEVSPVAVLLAAIAIVTWGAPVTLERSRLVMRSWLAAVGPVGASDTGVDALLAQALLQVGGVLLPFLLATALVGAGAMIAQVGFGTYPNLLAPDPSRVSPAKGWQRIFSAAGAMNLVKAVLKIAVVLGIAWHVLWRVGTEALSATDMPLDVLLAFTAGGIRELALIMAIGLGVLGAGDYLWQRWRFEQNLKMTRHEVKEEQKESEGDPHIRARFKRAHRELAGRRMLAQVAQADVVLTNPIHVAVALRYRADEMVAPQVIAKGAGEQAERIKEAARRAGVPIVERRALARALFRSVRVGAEVPPALYRAVAEILAYIYSLRGVRVGEAR
jgi:flagellar biosynthetic protein FlhB